MPATVESPYDHAAYEAARLTLMTLPLDVEHTLVRHQDNSDHGRAELFFADPDDAERYVDRLKTAAAAGALDQPHFHPWPSNKALDLMVFAVTRRV